MLDLLIFASRTFNSSILNRCYNVGTPTYMVYFSIIILVYFSIIIYKIRQAVAKTPRNRD